MEGGVEGRKEDFGGVEGRSLDGGCIGGEVFYLSRKNKKLRKEAWMDRQNRTDIFHENLFFPPQTSERADGNSM